MDIAKDEYITGKNRVQAAVDNMALSFLEIKPKFVNRAREMFECECQFYLDDAGDELLQDVMNRVFTDWVLFESKVFDSSAIQYYLANCDDVSDENRGILGQVNSNQKFDFFRFDGLLEDGVNGNGIFVYDPFAGREISVYSEASHEYARNACWSTGTGVSMRITEVDGESYVIGQFFAHDKAQFDGSMTLVSARLSHAYNTSPMLPIAMDILNPNGLFRETRVIESTLAA